MWIKLLLLLLYFLLLFALSRILEVVSWCNNNTNGDGFDPRSLRLLDPLSLSVQKLKQLLDNRGVSYSGVFEKKELVQLVQMSGSPSTEELEGNATSSDEIQAPAHQTTHFKCGSHFYEEVEDTKDSVWLVQVTDSDGDVPLLDESTWNDVVRRVSRFGIRTGVFHCSMDKRICQKKSWNSPRLILALPQGHKAKEDVILHSYVHSSRPQVIFNWVRKRLTSRMMRLRSQKHLQIWLNRGAFSKSSEVSLIMFSKLEEPPLFLSSLAIKFTGRVKFSFLHVDGENGTSLYDEYLNGNALPQYVILTKESKLNYGLRRGENFTFRDMELFLRFLRPEMNDIFLWSLILVNALVGFELFFWRSKLWIHVLRCFVCFVKYNSVLFLTWLLILMLFRFPFMFAFTNVSLKMVRLINVTNVASTIRCDWKNFCSWHLLLSVYVIFGGFCRLLLRRLGHLPSEDDYSIFYNWFLFPWSNSVMSYFFRPMATLSRSAANMEFELEDGIELLIERLAVPNLWLQPMISVEYIKDLPLWKYRGWCDADDFYCDTNKPDSSNSSDEDITYCLKDNISSAALTDALPDTESRLYSGQITEESDRNQSHIKSVSGRCSSPNGKYRDYNGKNSNSAAAYPKPKHIDSLVSQNASLPSSFVQNNKPDSANGAARAPPGMLESRDCSICLENYHYGEGLCGLPCGHNFHANCIMPWLYRDNHCCPVCRWPSYKSKSRNMHPHSQ